MEPGEEGAGYHLVVALPNGSGLGKVLAVVVSM